jgi:hypothetical protein
MHAAMQTDRRPAIWPWLVMPLIALTAFYCLDRFAREAKERDDLAPAPAMVRPQVNGDANVSPQAADAGDSDAAATDADGDDRPQR